MNTLVIVNPNAGRGAGLRVWRRIEGLLAGCPGIDAIIPSSCRDACKAAVEAARAGFRRVVVIGGDGTLTAVAGQLVNTDTVLGVVPAGTGNDFCRNARIPLEPEQALSLALHAAPRRMDMGQVGEGTYFLNAVGLGFDAEVAAVASGYPKGLGGTLPYLLGALSTMLWYKPMHVEVTADSRRFSGPSTLVVIANGRCYGGGMQIAPHACSVDGMLDVCVAGDLGRLEVLDLLRRVYTGTHIHHPKITVMRGRQVSLQVMGQPKAHMDGELLRWDTLDFRVRPRALSVAAAAA